MSQPTNYSKAENRYADSPVSESLSHWFRIVAVAAAALVLIISLSAMKFPGIIRLFGPRGFHSAPMMDGSSRPQHSILELPPDVNRRESDVPANSPPLAIAPFAGSKAREYQEAWAKFFGLPVEREIVLPGEIKLVMMLIPPGEFMRSEDDGNTWFRVRLTRPFYLGKYEVSQAEWQAVTGRNPSNIMMGPNHPVIQISWEDIQRFMSQLNAAVNIPGWRFGLPSEAQWEHACRAGTTGAFSFGDRVDSLPQYAWYQYNSAMQLHPVGQLKPNAFGLYDMHGNVWEFCADNYVDGYYAIAPLEDPPGPKEGSHRVGRGGSWEEGITPCRTAFRERVWPFTGWNIGGFRLAMTGAELGDEAHQAETESDNRE